MSGGTRQGNEAPRVIVVILVYCNADDAAACLESLAKATYPALDILVVDNASPDGAGARLREQFPNVHHLAAEQNGGYTAGNNLGFAWALERGCYDYVLVLNDDTIVDPHCVERLVEAAQETRAAAVAPQMLYYDEPNVVWYAGGSVSDTRIMCTHFGYNRPPASGQQRMPITFICGCCFLWRVEVLRVVGMFDESFFMYGEDLELSIRLRRAGYTMVYEPAASLLHRIKRDKPSSPHQVELRDKNRRRIARRHYGSLGRLRFAAWFYPTRLIHLVQHMLKGEWAHARAQMDGAVGTLKR